MKRLLFVFPLVSALVFAQSDEGTVHHHNIVVEGAAAIPTGSSSNYLKAAPMLGFRYGYRFNRLLQAEGGLQLAFGAANNQNAVVTDIGTVRGGDHEFMIPLGGRVYLPLPFKKIEVSAGGGAAYLHYSETAPSTGYYTNNCYTCTSRGGWGGYGLANVNYFLDENQTFHVGTTFQYISANTNGQAVGNVPALKTTDHWANILFEFGLSF